MGNIIFGIIIAIPFTVGVWHEMSWRLRSEWAKKAGVIVGNSRSCSDNSHPEVEYTFNGAKHRFTSKYEGSHQKVGAEVVLLVSPDGAQAEIYTWCNRWLFTLMPLAFSAIFLTCQLIAVNS